jgi:hypothetical protein
MTSLTSFLTTHNELCRIKYPQKANQLPMKSKRVVTHTMVKSSKTETRIVKTAILTVLSCLRVFKGNYGPKKEKKRAV